MFGELDGAGFESLDPRFDECFIGHARVERLWTGGRWCEGPAWLAAGRYLVWSDIPNDRMMRWDETDGSVSVFRTPCNNTNGHTVDCQGRLVSCEHLTRRVTRTNFDGSIEMLADHDGAARLNSPNDVVVKSDGSVWFTDPSYGIMSDYEGERAESETGLCAVYKWSPEDGSVQRVSETYDKPNGLAFSPDEAYLYIADTGATHTPGGPACIRRHAVLSDGTLGEPEHFADCTAGLFDGFRVDLSGRIWTSAADGVHCLDTDGSLIGKVRIPEMVSNVCFGGAKRNRLFITATTSLYAVYLNVNGVR